MIVELINTGSELMVGRVLNTHQQWLCRQLADAGYCVSRQVAVPDAAECIQVALKEALCRADLVIVTGGLGPTSDDVTRDSVARLLGLPLREDPELLRQIELFFTERGRPIPAAARGEAMVPLNAVVLKNRNGTAAGLALEVPAGRFRHTEKSSWLILLPGPPRELRPMFTEFALPWIREKLPSSAFVCRTFRTCGLGESQVQARVGHRLADLVVKGLSVGYCARPGEVDVRLAFTGADAEKNVAEGEALVRHALGEHVYAADDVALEGLIVGRLTDLQKTVAIAESCTGGCISDRITNVPGASAVFRGAFITYSNLLKEKCLGVKAETLRVHGAVSEPVVREMAAGALGRGESDFAIAVTGIAGPGGGTDEKPAGTVFIALATRSQVLAWRMINPWDRRTFKEVTTQQALNILRLAISAA
ncbi:MAG TPA: competence/damage-inducible protein A [Verrucomicrobiae bacterium]|nr:competence/damage-inducible protein A [Verrucomicrobiae bacterium]